MISIDSKQSAKLKDNWGAKAESLQCQAELRVYDPLSDWQCYIYAMNPDNENEIMCLISGGKNIEPVTVDWTLYEMSLLYNSHGEGVEIDTEYRPRQTAELFKMLNRGFR